MTHSILTFAPSTGATLRATSEFVVVACDDHGTKVTSDFESARLYVGVARACAADVSVDHHRWHYTEGTDCWVDGPCCVVDPYGFFD